MKHIPFRKKREPTKTLFNDLFLAIAYRPPPIQQYTNRTIVPSSSTVSIRPPPHTSPQISFYRILNTHQRNKQTDSIMSPLDDKKRPSSSENKDFVIRNGFPALLRNDGSGPLIHGDEPIPQQLFASFHDALVLSDSQTFINDCTTVFTARTMEDGAAYSAGTTYFIPAMMKPRCALEALALTIFKAHTKGLEQMYRPEQSGAEFWTLVMDAAPPKISANEDNNEDDDDDEDEDHAEVGIHFDADYGLEEQVPGMLLHPRLATVTYLSDVGAPTLVLNKQSPAPGTNIVEELGGDIDRGWLSGPKFGKHIAFDGRLLHGAPATFFPGSNQEGNVTQSDEPHAKRQKVMNEKNQEISQSKQQPKLRVTFMVNIWLNHCPLDADLLDDDIVKQLKTPWETSIEQSNDPFKLPFEWKANKPDTLDTPCLLGVFKQDPAGSEETVMCNHKVEICFNEKMEIQHEISRKTATGSSIELTFQKGAVTLKVGDEVSDDDSEGDKQ